MRCPGQHNQTLTVSYHRCPGCGALVELFSDETQARCRACKGTVYKEQTPSCVQWCKAARECIGPQRYDEMMRQLEEAMDRKSRKEGKKNGAAKGS